MALYVSTFLYYNLLMYTVCATEKNRERVQDALSTILAKIFHAETAQLLRVFGALLSAKMNYHFMTCKKNLQIILTVFQSANRVD